LQESIIHKFWTWHINISRRAYTHTHTHTYIYIYIWAGYMEESMKIFQPLC
jgi:hypothetical protein